MEGNKSAVQPDLNVNKKKKGLEAKYTKSAYFMLSPFAILAIITIFIPVIVSLAFSFSDIGSNITFVGLDNYKMIFRDPTFFKSYTNVFIIMLGSIPITILLALIFAVLLNMPGVKGQGVFRTIYYLPAVTSIVAVTSVFLTFYNPTGIFNTMLGFVGIDPVPWLNHPIWARVAMIIISIWLNVGYYTVMFLAGLQGISAEVYESAEIDGASKIKQFFLVTVPLLKPIILMALVLSTINGLGAFEVPNILFKNGFGPEQSAITVGVNLYKTSFELVEFGRASAIAWTMVAVAVVLSFIQFKLGGSDNEE